MCFSPHEGDSKNEKTEERGDEAGEGKVDERNDKEKVRRLWKSQRNGLS